MSPIRKSFATLAGAAVALTGVAALPDSAAANPAGTGLVINEAYLNGGSAGATYTHKYVELYNPTDAPISLAGKSIQYRSGSGTGVANTSVALVGEVPANGYFLLQGSSNGANGAPLPTPDQTSSLGPSGSTGTLFLAEGTTAISPGTPADPDEAIIDLVGYGSSNMYEGTVASAASVTTSVSRDETGADTDVNSADFAALEVTPKAVNPGGGTEPTDPVDATIAEIQGTADTSPLAGQLVKTTGVVTAAYPTGGFNGFYIQTPGLDTPDASDGVFVYKPEFDAGIAVGDSVEVVGTAKEFSGLTEIEVGATGMITQLPESLGTVTAKPVIPGTDCALPGTDCPAGTALDAAREKSEGELFAPAGDYTVTDAYDGSAFNPPSSPSSSSFGEIGLAANSDIPLVTPTEVIDAQATVQIAERVAYNNAHRVVLDDGASTTYWNTSNTGQMDKALPWQTTDHYVRVGAGATFAKPVVLEYRFGWKVQPTAPVTGTGAEHVAFEQNRTDAPEEVGGDVTLATFNVLNYFTTLGEDVAGCTSYKDREGNPIAVNQCPGDGPRGAWNDASFERQQDKIVNAINTIDADVISLEELENSVKVDGGDRDEAISALVTALNTDAGSTRWAYAPSPAAADLPPLAEQDVIRTGFIYNPETVELVGESEVLVGEEAFNNAREPLAQAFKATGADDADAFGVIVNHFKSKGSGVDDGTGQGKANPDRIAQADKLADFANLFATERGIGAVFLTGDFNSYGMEDPIQKLDEKGFAVLESDTPDEWSYNFDGQAGSLDHVLGNTAATELVTGVDIWESNANETVFRQYSRFNYNFTDFYVADQFSASDHNPEVIGIDLPDPQPGDSTTTVAADPASVKVLSGETELTATVSADGTTPTGDVEFFIDGESAGTATLAEGVATLSVGPFDSVGAKAVEARYAGSGTVNASTGSTSFDVVKRTPAMTVKKKPARVVVKKTKAKLVVLLTADGGPVNGSVKVRVAGKGYAATVTDGRAVVQLKPFKKTGKYTAKVRFLANATDNAVAKTVTIKVVRR